MRRIVGRWPIYLLLVLGLGISFLPLGNSSAGPNGSTTLNGFRVEGNFLEMWRGQHSFDDSVMLNGYPISDRHYEVNPSDGKVYQVQWFERARYEDHPDDAPNDVQLSLLGSITVANRKGEPPFQPVPQPTTPDPAVEWIRETGHSMSGPIRVFWDTYGTWKQFGLPISEQFTDTINGVQLPVQYFERARLELHTGPDGKPQVQVGLLGVEQYRPDAVVTPIPTP